MKAFKSGRQALFVLLALVAASLYLAKGLSITCVPPSEKEFYTVEFEWFGMDAEKIERLVALPLEEKIGGLEKLVSLSTVCEWSKCSASAVFEKSGRGAFFALSAAANELSQSLPSEAQKPRVYAGAASSKWIFCAAFDAKKHSLEELEKKLKAPLQSVRGASRAVFSGGQTEEIQLAYNGPLLDHRKAAPWNLAEIARSQKGSAIFGNGFAFCQDAQSAKELNAIQGLSSAASARDGFQRKNSIVRVNGAECLLAGVQSASESQNIWICKEARKILKREFPQKGDFQIILDNGREQEKMLGDVFLAFFQSLAALAACAFFFYKSAKKALMVLLWTSLALLFAAAAMGALKIPLDSAAISGVTISLGLLCDAALYMADDCQSSFSAMAAASLTTICALLPLCALNPLAPGIKAASLSCVLAVGISSLMAPLFLPLFFKKEANARQKARKFPNLSTFSYIKPRNILRLSTFLYILAPIIFAFSPKNLCQPDATRRIYAQVEYPAERSADAIDKDLEDFLEKAKKINGVEFVQSEARRGSAEIQLVLKSAGKKDKAAKELLALSSHLSGNLYVPLSPPKRKIVQRVRVGVIGDQSAVCQEECKKAAAALMQKDFAAKGKAQAVLNFKDSERIYLARPNRALLDRAGVSVQSAAQSLRWALFGAVAKKARYDGGAKDIRVGERNFAFGKPPTLEEFSAVKTKGLSLAALCSIESAAAPPKIFRQNGKRAAYFTIELESNKSDKAFKQIKAALKDVRLPQGYWLDFPREYEDLEKNYALAAAAFLLAMAAIYVLTAAQCERPLDALKAALTVPLSLFLPLAIRAATLCPLTLGDAAGMTFVSGFCVNNAIYIMNEFNLKGRKDAFAAARAVSKSVLSSSATTMAGSLPLLFFAAQGFAKDLAFFTFFGTLGSLAASLVFFPETLGETKKAARRKKDSRVKRGNDSSISLAFKALRTCSWGLSSSRQCQRASPKQLRQERT